MISQKLAKTFVPSDCQYFPCITLIGILNFIHFNTAISISFSGQKAHLNFDVDYWGLSNKYALEYIIKNNKYNSEKINVSNFK